MSETAAERYKKQLIENPPEVDLVTVTAPSGFAFIFQKPTPAEILFGIGTLPLGASSIAVESWQRQGAIPDLEGTEGRENIEKILKVALKARDQVLKLSHSPKIVTGEADPAADELSASDISGPDLQFLLTWVSSGGTMASSKLATFPGRPGQSAPVGDNRKERRTKAKQAGGRSG